MQHQAMPHQDGGNDQPVHLVTHQHAVQDQHAADQVAGPSGLQGKELGNERGDVNDAAADAYGLPYAAVAELNTANDGPPSSQRMGAPPDAPISAHVHNAETEVCLHAVI